MTRKHFCVNAWGPGGGQFWLIRADADWVHLDFWNHWLSITVGLFGFVVCVTWWPRGMQ